MKKKSCAFEFCVSVRSSNVSLSFHRRSRISPPWKIVYSQLIRRLSMAVSELILLFFLMYLAHDLRFTNAFLFILLYAF